LPELQTRHEARAENSPDFIYLRDQIERTRVIRQKEQLSLNEVKVKEEREESRRTEFDAENMRRLLKGLPLNEWVADLNEEDDEESLIANDDTASPDEPEEDATEDEGDPLLLESGRILADFIALNANRVSAVTPPVTRSNR